MKSYRHITVIILAIIIIYALVNINMTSAQLNEARAAASQLKTQISAVQSENEELARKIQDLGTDEAVIELARQRLGLVMPDEVVFVDTNGK